MRPQKGKTAVGALAVLIAACGDSFQPLESPADPPPAEPSEPPNQLPGDPLAAPAVIFLTDADGSNAELLTEGDGPAWSPDGQRVAFHRGGRIHVIHTDGSEETPLAEGRDAAWSPEGTHIAFTGVEGIVVVRADGSGLPTLIRPDFRDDPIDEWEQRVRRPTWSPHGERIAFERTVDLFGLGPFTQIYVMNSDGSEARRLTSIFGHQFNEHRPTWSPDGSRVAFTSRGGVAVADAIGGTPSLIYQGGSDPAWSPDGATVAFTVHARTDPTIWVVRSDGEAARALLQGGRHPAWSPDGTRMAVVRGVTPAFPPVLPPVSGTAEVYDRESPHTSPPGAISRYVLYDDGTFELHYLAHAHGRVSSYAGRYSRTGSAIAFDFDPSGWEATGTLADTRLHVEYNVIMVLTDFEDGVYVLREGLSTSP